WQLGTVQVDYQLPKRFDLSYIGADNKPHPPVMIHRAPFGSMERFVAVLIEHFAGAFPLWLAPVQVAVLSISEKSEEYANRVAQQLKDAGLRVEANTGAEKIGAKIRAATLDKTPYMLVVGEQEAAAGKVAVRHRTAGDQGTMALQDFVERAKQEVASRAQSAAAPESPAPAR
ncbi:MAG TPA: His/Gly/Thr/Pro-type tRNA ligase C-terminal domain-containing protein, partial [Tepidisphaeraceae bacterium]|nr:His/Gly/Thr/Pro-type tRNA ligase C-terminal domain-containing protein [Tepidisphaeraceae bacterium]